MPRTCTVCKHKDRAAIERSLLAGETYRQIAEFSGTSITALHRHRQDHLPKALVKAKSAREVARADSLLDDVRGVAERAIRLHEAGEEMLKSALKQKDWPTVATAIKSVLSIMGEERQCLELRAELAGELGRNASPPPAQTTIQVLCLPKAPGVAVRPPALISGAGEVCDAE